MSTASPEHDAPAPSLPLRTATIPDALRRLVRLVREALLTLAALGGAVCIAAVIAAVTFDLSLVMFRTGSMTPAIPPGSVALVRQVPADQVGPGDVVTVDRPGALSVTHRVVTASTDVDGVTTLTMKGDANPGPDPQPYQVTDVKQVLGSMPGVARLVTSSGHPYALGLATVAATGLVTWAFWPAGPTGAGRTRRTPRGSGRLRPAAGAAAVAAAVAIATWTLVPGPGALAAESSEGRGRYLHVISDPDPARFPILAPGDTVVWVLGITADPPDIGEITRTLRASGPLAEVPGALTVTVRGCDRAPTEGRCPGPATTLLGPVALTDLVHAEGSLGTQPTNEQAWILVEAQLDAEVDSSVRGKDASMVLSAHGHGLGRDPGGPGDPGSPSSPNGPRGPLAHTGMGLLAPAALALAALLGGLTLAALARRRTESPS